MGEQHSFAPPERCASVPPRLWSQPFIAATIANLFMPSAFYLLLTTMAGYAISSFAASDAMAGFASSSFVVGSVFGRLVAGRSLTLVGGRQLLLASMLGYVVVSFLYIPVGSLWVLIILRLVHGLTFGVGNTALVASVQSVIPPERRAEGNGYFSVATTLSTAAGPFLAVVLTERYGYPAVFVAAGIAGAIALIAGWFFTVPAPASTPPLQPIRRAGASGLVDRAAAELATIIGLAGFAVAGVMGFIALHTEHMNIPQAASLFFVAYAAASLIARLVLGRVQDTWGDNIVVLPVFLAFIGGVALLGGVHTTPGVMLAGLLTGVGFGSLLPALLAIVVRVSDPGRVAVATSTYYLALDIGSGIGPIVMGAAITVGGYRAMYLAGAAVATLGFVLYVKNQRPKHTLTRICESPG